MSRPCRRPALAALMLLVPLLVTALAPAAAAVPPPATPTETTPVMVVLDASGSMKQADAPGPRIDAAKRAVGELVAALPDDARVGLTVYGTGTGSSDAEKARGCKDITQLVPVERVDRAAFGRAVAGLRASGYTPIGESLRVAARGLPAEGPRSIVLVSDGEDTCAPPPPCEVAKQLKQSGIDLVVHTIGFKVGAAARAQLTCIASATGGSYREASSGAALGAELTSRVKRAIRPYQAVGTPIRGGAAPADAPEIRPGQYLDTYERGAPPAEDGTRKFYAVQLKPGDTPHFSATIAPPAVRATNITALMVQLAIVDAEGESCGPSSNGGADVAVFGKVTAQTAVLDPPPVGDRPWRESCSAGDRPLYVQVTRGGSAFGTQQLPVELAFRLEPAVRDAGPPAIVAMAEKLPAPASGPARPVEAGTSFNDAPVLSPGTYRDSITTGETRYFRVPLGWGQRLAYRVSIPTQGLPIQTAALYAVLASPLRAKAEQVTDSGTYELLGGKTDQEVSGSSAVPVRYLNRESSLSEADEYSVDGTYYLVLDLSYRLGKDEPVSFPFTLTVATSGGEPGPAYLTDPEPGGGGTASPTAPPTVAASPASTGGSGSAGSGGPAPWVLAAAGTGAVLVAGAFALPWWRRRRSAG